MILANAGVYGPDVLIRIDAGVGSEPMNRAYEAKQRAVLIRIDAGVGSEQGCRQGCRLGCRRAYPH